MSNDALKMPKRQHYIKTQFSVPAGSKKMAERRDKAIQYAVEHMKLLAGFAAHNVEIRAVFQERGEAKDIMQWNDILVVMGFDGPLNETTKKLAIERKTFETDKLFDGLKGRKPGSILS